MKLFVGNIAYATTEEGLRAHFEEFGPLVSCSIVMDRETGRSRGFGFIEVANSTVGEAAIAKLNGSNLDGKDLAVNEARPRTEGGPRRSGGGFRQPREGSSFGGGRSSSRGNSRGGYSGGRW